MPKPEIVPASLSLFDVQPPKNYYRYSKLIELCYAVSITIFKFENKKEIERIATNT